MIERRGTRVRRSDARRVSLNLSRGAILAAALLLLGVLGWLSFANRSRARAGESVSPTSATLSPASLGPTAPRQPTPELEVAAADACCSVRGQVLDEFGSAIGKATICTRMPAGSDSTPVCRVSDAHGRFSLKSSANPVALVATAAGYFPSTLALSRFEHSLEDTSLVLRRGGETVSGVVVDATGGTVAGALVTAKPSNAEGVESSTFSDDNGQFRLAATRGVMDIGASAEAYSKTSTQVLAPAIDVRLTIAPATRITGQVVRRHDQTPLANARVIASTNGAAVLTSALTRDDGSFEIAALNPGSYDLWALGASFRSDKHRVTAGVGEHVGPVVLEAVTATTLTGTVQNGAQLCEGGSAELTGPVYALQALGAAAQLHFEGLLPGDYEIRIDCPASASTLQERILVGADPVSRVWHVDAALFVRGRVETLDGAGVPGISVEVHPVGNNPGRRGSICSTDAAGEFACALSAPGDYLCRAQRGDVPASDGILVSFVDAEPAPIVLKTKGSGTIRVFVDGLRAPGTPTQGLVPAVRRPGGPSIIGQAAQDHFSFAELPLGKYEVYLGDPDGATSVSLEGDEAVLDVHLQAPPTRDITGRVVDELAHEPVPDVWVAISASDPPELIERLDISPVLTDERGEFVLPSLPMGRYALRATGEGAAATLANVTPGAPATLALQRVASLFGTVHTASGEKVLDAVVTCHDELGRESRQASSFDGTWTVSGLLPGTYRLEATSSRGSGWQEAKLLPGHEQKSLVIAIEAAAAPTQAAAATKAEDQP